MMFTTIEQVKQIMQNYLHNGGRGGFITGTIKSISPLTIQADRITLTENDLYVTDSCIGLIMHYRHKHAGDSGGQTDEQLQDDVILRQPFAVGEGVLLLCRPEAEDGSKYIVLDRIQPYQNKREVSAK